MNNYNIDTHSSEIWSRAIILVDMNAFFASVEQLDNPKLRGKPVGVTNGEQGTCMITCSYEARAKGLKTGMRLKEGRKLCPELIQCPARPQRYAEISTRIMKALEDITPDVEVFSVDEAFLDVTRCQRLLGNPADIARMVQQKVFEVSGLHCSVGVSGDKTTAKYAAKLVKPSGLTVIPPWEAKTRLKDVPVTELSGIAQGIGNFLAQYDVYNCGDMEKLPISVLARRFGNLGRRIWYMCQGQDPSTVSTQVAPPQSMGHGKMMPPNTSDRQLIFTYLMHMSEKLTNRLRRHDMEAREFYIGILTNLGWIGGTLQSELPTNNGKPVIKLCYQFLREYWHGEGVYQVQVTALDPKIAGHQLNLFEEDTHKQDMLNVVIDNINRRYGEFTAAPTRILNRSITPNVIAPAWKPEGHRQTI